MNIQLSEHFGYKKLFRFVLPTIFMIMFSSAYAVVDGLFISNFAGKTAFAAINLIVPVTVILGGVGFMFGAGGRALVGKALGEGDREQANRYFTMIIVAAFFTSIVLAALGIGLMRYLAIALKASEDMLDYCVLYGRIVCGFLPFYMFQYIFQSFFAVAEKSKLGFIITVIAGCTNIVLDALFIVAFKWGVAGAAIATGIGQMVGGGVPLIYFLRKNSSLLKFVKTKIEIKPVLKMLWNGSSDLVTNVATSIVSMLYNLQLMKYAGEDGVSAYGVVMYIMQIFTSIEIGFTMGSAPLISYNYGAENHDELKSLFKKSIISMSVCGVALFGLAEALAIPIAKIFMGQYPDLYDMTVKAIFICSFSFILSGVNIFSSGFFTALNNGTVSAILAFLRSMIFQIAFILVLPIFWQLNGVWFAMTATEVVSIIIAVIFFIAMRKKYHYA